MITALLVFVCLTGGISLGIVGTMIFVQKINGKEDLISPSKVFKVQSNTNKQRVDVKKAAYCSTPQYRAEKAYYEEMKKRREENRHGTGL